LPFINSVSEQGKICLHISGNLPQVETVARSKSTNTLLFFFIHFKTETPMKLLALDIATKTGWKTATASGTWDLTPNKGESSGMRLIRFRAKLIEIIKAENIRIIAYERPAGFHKQALIIAGELVGVLKTVAEEYHIHLACYSATEIKKFATGKGNATKEEMIKAAQKKGYNPQDDNEADAIHLYDLAIQKLLLNTPSPIPTNPKHINK
jgi:Holliday junction resolvasome RuvABC endonuclease subunit